MQNRHCQFYSNFLKVRKLSFPAFSGTRIMMMPIILGDMKSIPTELKHYMPMVKSLFTSVQPKYLNQVGYLTIDESNVLKGETHRRPGLHVDGFYKGKAGSWGGSGPWAGARKNIIQMLEKPINIDDEFQYGPGMLLIASHPGCVAWKQIFKGMPGPDGECDHLISQCKENTKQILEPNMLYWLSPLTVHAATEMPEDTNRQLLRLSMPSKAPVFSEYTKNPLGIEPSGPVIAAARGSQMRFRSSDIE